MEGVLGCCPLDLFPVQFHGVETRKTRAARKSQREGPWNPAMGNGKGEQTCQEVSFGSPVICIR